MTNQMHSLPRLSPIGWSIDESSDLHAAVFDIATGGSGILEERRNESPKSRSHNKDQSTMTDVSQLPALDEVSRSRRISSAQLPLRRPKTSDRAHSASFLSSSVKTLRKAASRDALHASRQASQAESSSSALSVEFPPDARGGRMSRTPSLFKFKRPFGSRTSSYRSTTEHESNEVGPSTVPAISAEQSFSLLVTTNTNESNSTDARASSEQEYGQGRAINVRSSTTSLSAPAFAGAQAESERSQLPSIESQGSSIVANESFDAPLLSSRSTSSGGSSAAPKTLRRKRGHPPMQAAPTLPLPPLPPVATKDIVTENEKGKAVEDVAVSKGTSGSSDVLDRERTVRKTKSQTGLGMLRARSILGGHRNSSAEKNAKTAAQKLPSSTPWGTSTASRLDMSDSSPEVERASLAPSEESRRLNASTPSLEEARAALDPDRIETLRIRSGAPPTFLHAPGSSQDLLSVSPSGAPVKSKLESSGGAGSLFGGPSSSGGRSRAPSLIPWRQRTTSSTILDPSSAGESSSAASQRSSAEKPVKITAEGFDVANVDSFLQHVLASAPRADVPALLAATGDALHKKALQLYMQQFLFTGHPLDVALRKLLMSLCLPKETQQIDRVMEAFARRYNECNENLFVSHDQPYMLAFSLMMLHTDTFNRNAKQKMSRSDYVRNTSASGVASEILEYLYDNLTFTQFIYVEDDDFLRRRKSDADSTSSALRAAFTPSNNSVKDPYQIIASGQTHTLRPSVQIDEDSPFSALGTLNAFDLEALLHSFVNAPSIEIVTARKAPLPSTAAALGGYYSTLPSVSKEEESIVTLRVTKVGCVSRKDDLLEYNKKAGSRKWKTCGMILSSSQLLFFRDLVWTSALDQRIKEQMQEQPDQKGGVLITPQITYFKPDGVLALSDAMAIKDSTYSKYNHVFRLLARHGDIQRQYLIQTASEEEMNDWIHKINFCAAFRSAGLRIRGLDISPDDPSTPSTPSNLDIGDGIPASDCSPVPSPNVTIDSPNTAMPMVGLLRRKLKARLREFQPVIDKVTGKLDETQQELDEKLRFARHLMIATPFMKSTRDRLEAIAVPLAQEVRQLRLEVARHSCRREILLLELEAGNCAAKAAAPAAAFDHQTEDRVEMPWTPNGSRMASFSASRTSSSSQTRAASLSHDKAFVLPAAALRSPRQSNGDHHAYGEQQSTPRGNFTSLPEESNHNNGNAQTATPSSFMNSASALPSMHFTPLGISYANSKDSGLIASSESSSPKQKSKANGGSGSGGPKKSFFRSHNSSSSPTNNAEQDEQERWDRTKMGRDADKRISLVMNLPEAQQWQTLTSKRIPLSPSTERAPNSSTASTRSSQKKTRSHRSSSVSSSSQTIERRTSAAKDLTRLYG